MSRKFSARKVIIGVLVLSIVCLIGYSGYFFLRRTTPKPITEPLRVNKNAQISAKTILRATPLTEEAFKPYGQIISASSKKGQPVNNGKATRWNFIAKMQNPKRGKANMSLIRTEPVSVPVKLDILERHKFTNQMFSPMHASRYLVIVCLGDPEPDMSTLRAFLATDRQGVNYAIGTWHYMLTALDQDSEFTSFMYFVDGSDGTELFDVTSLDIAVFDQ